MRKMVYMDYWAGLVRQARLHRKHFPEVKDVFQTDPEPPENYTAEDVDFALKLVAHWEGGPDPASAEAVPVEVNERFEEES